MTQAVTLVPNVPITHIKSQQIIVVCVTNCLKRTVFHEQQESQHVNVLETNTIHPILFSLAPFLQGSVRHAKTLQPSISITHLDIRESASHVVLTK